jgi:hypothetical protein
MSQTSLSAIKAVLEQKKQEVIAKAEVQVAKQVSERINLAEAFDGGKLKSLAKTSPGAESAALSVLDAIAKNPNKSKTTLIQAAATEHKVSADKIQKIFDAMGISFSEGSDPIKVEEGVEQTATDFVKSSKPKSFKIGTTVVPNKGPHKGVPHEIIHLHDDGEHANVKPIGLMPKNVKYRLGAAKVNLQKDLQEAVLDELSKDTLRSYSDKAKKASKELGDDAYRMKYDRDERAFAPALQAASDKRKAGADKADKKLGEDFDTLAEDMEVVELVEDWVPMAKVKPGQVEKVKTRKSGNNYFYVVSTDLKDKTFEVVTPKAFNDGDTDNTMTVAFSDVVMASTDSFAEDGEKGGKKPTGVTVHLSGSKSKQDDDEDEEDKKSKKRSANKAIRDMEVED